MGPNSPHMTYPVIEKTLFLCCVFFLVVRCLPFLFISSSGGPALTVLSVTTCHVVTTHTFPFTAADLPTVDVIQRLMPSTFSLRVHPFAHPQLLQKVDRNAFFVWSFLNFDPGIKGILYKEPDRNANAFLFKRK